LTSVITPCAFRTSRNCALVPRFLASTNSRMGNENGDGSSRSPSASAWCSAPRPRTSRPLPESRRASGVVRCMPQQPVSVLAQQLAWKKHELDARFYRGRPKDGSIRVVDLPAFLQELLAGHLGGSRDRRCTCRDSEPPWCSGDEYVFLGPRNGHFRRSNYAARVVRPAADGWYPGRLGRNAREAAPVLVDASGPRPGVPLPPWPPARPGVPFTPPSGREALCALLARTATAGAGSATARLSSGGMAARSVTPSPARSAAAQARSRMSPSASRPGCRCGPG